MVLEKQGWSQGGAFLHQMFDWNAMSRKKLFPSSKSESPVEQQSKHKKRCDGNLPMTRLRITDVDENGGGPSSIKPPCSSDCNCPSPSSSSVVDEDIHNVAPGVVARLMGLDALPKCTPYSSTPLLDSRSFQGAHYQPKIRGYCLGQDKDVPVGNDSGSKYHQKLMQIHRPIDKFQDEILPPRSARSIPITHHKLMSPIKSSSFTPSKDAARMMEEVAGRIIDPRATPKTRGTGSSSVPIKVRDLKERARAAERQSQGKGESRGGVKNNRSSNGGGVVQDSDGGKSKGKSISLALLAKANVQKREGLNLNSSRRSPRELHEVNPNLKLDDAEPDHRHGKDESKSNKRQQQSAQIGSCVLQQNNQKQNCIVDKGNNSYSKCRSKDVKVKPLRKEPSSSRQPCSSRPSTASKVSSRNNSCSEVKDDDRGITSKKRSIDGAYRSGKSKPSCNIPKDKNQKSIQSSSWGHSSEGEGTDIVSFTFTSPMTRSEPDSRRSVKASGDSSKISLGSQTITSPLSSGCSKFSFPVCNVKGSDALSILLDQKLQELAHKVDLSQQKSGTMLHELHGKTIEDHQALRDLSIRDSSTMSRAQKLLDCHIPSPVSILEHFSFGDRCSSPESADSNSTEGSKPHSLSTQTQQVLDLHSPNMSSSSISTEGEAELSDSASSTTTETRTDSQGELDYIRQILCNIEPMFTNYVSGRSNEIISPRLFHRIGNRKGCLSSSPKQRLLFDCVRECLDMRCKKYARGGFQSWAKGESMVRHKDRLTEQVYREISDWSGAGDCMIDELVDQDMSGQYRKWLDYDTESFELGIRIESRVLNSLIDEAVADMLFL